MSGKHVGWVFEHSPFTGATFAVHLALGDVANDLNGHELWASIETTAAKARVSESSARRAYTELAEAGFIEKLHSGGGRHQTNRWRFLFPEVPAVFGSAKPAHGEQVSDVKPRHGEQVSPRNLFTDDAKPCHGDTRSIKNSITTPNGENSGDRADAPSPPPGDDEATIVQTIVACYVDDYRNACSGNDPPREWRAIAGREARKALRDGVSPENIKGCLWQITQERVKNPARLAYVISDAQAGVQRRPTR
jgi:hypothetical protein